MLVIQKLIMQYRGHTEEKINPNHPPREICNWIMYNPKEGEGQILLMGRDTGGAQHIYPEDGSCYVMNHIIM